MIRVILLVLLFFSAFSHAQIVIKDATVRLLPPGLPNTSAYLTVQNPSDQPVIIIGVDTDIVEKAELHNHVLVNDMMRMQQQAEILIAPGETVYFKPGGLHLMLFGLKAPLQQDQIISLSLRTKTGDVVPFTAQVVRPSSHSSHNH